jgi:hypothetical protein
VCRIHCNNSVSGMLDGEVSITCLRRRWGHEKCSAFVKGGFGASLLALLNEGGKHALCADSFASHCFERVDSIMGRTHDV